MFTISIIFGILAIIAAIVWLATKPPVKAVGGWATFSLALLGMISLGVASMTVVSAGHVGVMVLFGDVQEGEALDEGFHLVNPLMSIGEMSVRTETYSMVSGAEGADSITVLSADGMRMPVDVTVAYRLVGSDAPWVYQKLGWSYVDKIIRPATRTAVREAGARYVAQEAYAGKREEFAAAIQEVLIERVNDLLAQYDFDGKGFIVQQVMLRNVDLPDRVKSAIEEKLAAEQDALRMTFTLQKERQEAERKRIEAEGIRDFQNTVSEGITEELLRWKGIDATLEIAKSDNAKVVIVGSGDDGLPIILNTDR